MIDGILNRRRCPPPRRRFSEHRRQAWIQQKAFAPQAPPCAHVRHHHAGGDLKPLALLRGCRCRNRFRISESLDASDAPAEGATWRRKYVEYSR